MARAGRSHRLAQRPGSCAGKPPPPGPDPAKVFASQLLCPLEHFAELWQDALHRLVPIADGDPGGVALLTPGHADSDWFGHVLLARELSCALVECGDLTVRGGRLFLKTLRGLQPIGVRLRGEHGNRIDPLELAPDAVGVPELLEAGRDGGVRIVNHPGAGLAEAPALGAFLPALAQHLLGAPLQLPSVETHWLDEFAPDWTGDARYGVRDRDSWLVRPSVRRHSAPAHACDAASGGAPRPVDAHRRGAGQICRAIAGRGLRFALPGGRPTWCRAN